MNARTAGAVLAASVVSAILAGNLSWRVTTARTIRRLAAVPVEGEAAMPAERAEALPAPVARYLCIALPRDAPRIVSAHMTQTGTMRAAPEARWMPFTAVEAFTVRPPGFVWDASVRAMPFVPLRVRDGYVAGRGASEAALAGAIPVFSQPGGAEIDAAALPRFLAEAIWFPTFFAPGGDVAWTTLDERRARATLTDRGTTVSLDAEFAPNGELTTISAMRYRDVNGTPVLTRWIGRCSAYARFDGMMIPADVEVSWAPPEGAFAVWRGHLTAVRYHFAD
ncbi:hypothetical protein WPS_05740 [Vulcanimicrobium alpinum]|uniref:Uncharacterized protein n=1 Tax=Vulcanimicrobium alpinum TaxID=3016050 RepID=A0AAN1XT94_UNVUL|nr:DUF6544 family protein [Vulcanimicrobium alpinum]BDE05298.1 hypothetical protein WPS_05740 [Vulcanimicrobium alpinum]